ncbi:hypothetical protein RB600_006205 [Gaeumannomyces tritici]
MQLAFAVPVLLLWLQAAAAAPAVLVPRQASVIKGALSKVMDTLKSMDTAIKGLTPDINSAVPLLDKVGAAQKSIDEAGATIKSSKKLGLFESVGLLQPAQELTAQVQTTLGDLTAKKPVFDQLGVSPAVADALKQQKAASSGLADAMVGKLPGIAQGIAGGATGDLTKAVDDAIKAFEQPPAKAPGGGVPGATPKIPSSPAPAPATPGSPKTPGGSPAPAVPATPDQPGSVPAPTAPKPVVPAPAVPAAPATAPE